MSPDARKGTGAEGFVVAVRELSKSYRRGPEEVHALRSVSFALRPGEVVALIGPSGSGKTTLFNLLYGWEQPDAGVIRWASPAPNSTVDASSDSPAERRWDDVAIVPQDLGMLEELSVRENVELPIRLGGPGQAGRMERAAALLAGFGLEDLAGREPGELSMGEQQRAALARAVVLSPRLLLADEPTGHQDEQWARYVLRGIRMAAQEGTSCLVATHNNEALKVADRVLAIRDGRLHELVRTRQRGDGSGR
jgi:putative ABC transport system ATP-binding protein